MYTATQSHIVHLLIAAARLDVAALLSLAAGCCAVAKQDGKQSVKAPGVGGPAGWALFQWRRGAMSHILERASAPSRPGRRAQAEQRAGVASSEREVCDIVLRVR